MTKLRDSQRRTKIVATIGPATSSPEMLKDLKSLLEQRGFNEGSTSKPGDFVIERAFAEK